MLDGYFLDIINILELKHRLWIRILTFISDNKKYMFDIFFWFFYVIMRK
jgi:hypothetical protein